MRVRDDSGRPLNAEFGVEVNDGLLEVVLESAGGKVPGSSASRNHEYVPALRLLLTRLRDRDAVLSSALVASSRVSALPAEQRMLVREPRNLRDVRDVEVLRREITSAQGRIGQAQGARKEGNNRKRIRLRVEVPGYGLADAGRLADDLASPEKGSHEAAPEVLDAIDAADASAGRHTRAGKRPGGQGTRLSQADRTAIEKHAVALATRYLTGQGYRVHDVGAVESYDLDAVRGTEHLYVEVKGTTSRGEEVILTKNEVDLMGKNHPDTMLIVVGNIDLDRSGSTPRASGGDLRATHPWLIDPADLSPISYRYRVGR